MRPLTIYVSHSSEVFTDHRAHGDGIVAYQFVERLAQRGHRLHVAAQEIDLKRPLHPNVSVTLLKHRLRNPFLQRVEFALRSRLLMKRLQRTVRFDIVHQLNPVFAGLSLGVAGLGVPVVLGCYAARWPDDPDAIVVKSRVMKKILPKMLAVIATAQQRRAAAILLSSPAAENQLPDKASVVAKIHIVPYGTDSTVYTPAPDWMDAARWDAEQARPTVLFLASLNRRKGIYDLLEAFEIVSREVPACRLRIVGDGPEQPAVKALAEQSAAAARIERLPAMPRLATVDMYRDCTIFCSPSLGEPFGMAVCEAMACGRPLIVTRGGGHNYTADPGGAVLVPQNDSEALAAAILQLLRDPDARRAMSVVNRRRAEEMFGWDAVIDDLERVYAQVLGE